MKDRPDGVADADLVAALRDGWGFVAESTAYLPVGAGSYHWSATDEAGVTRFVTVDPYSDALRRALDTALALRLDIVVAPIPARDGSSVWRLGSRYAMSVFPMLDGRTGSFGAHRAEDRPLVVDMLVRLHDATPRVAATAPRTDLRLPGRDKLAAALASLGRPWTGGPYAEPARELLAAHADRVAAMLAEFDGLVDQVRDTDWVLTHGEPHPGNVIWTADGPRLVDWDTVRIAPPERDLWLLGDDVATLYPRPVNPAGLALYRLWWALADIAIFVDELHHPHAATADTTDSWTHLHSYLTP